MPQMSPTWWFTLLLVFTATFMIFLVMIYFNKMYKMKLETSNVKMKNNTLNWKW